MDARIRELERRWQASGDPEVEEQYLGARLRSGSLGWGSLETAAYLGDEVCRRLLGEDMLAYLPKASGLTWFMMDLPKPDREVLLRAQLVVLDAYQSHVAGHAKAWKRPFQVALDAGRSLLECPCDAHRAAAQAAGEELVGAYPRAERPLVKDGDPGRMMHELWCFLHHARTGKEPEFAPPPFVGTVDWKEVWSSTEQTELRERVTSTLLPWVLVRSARPEWAWDDDDDAFDLRRARLQDGPDPDELFTPDVPIDPAVAAQVQDALGPLAGRRSTLTNEQGARVVRAYLEARGWKRAGADALESPGRRRRVRIQRAQLRLLVRSPSGWKDKPSITHGDVRPEIPPSRVGELVLAGLRGEPAPARKPASAGQRAKPASATKRR